MENQSVLALTGVLVQTSYNALKDKNNRYENNKNSWCITAIHMAPFLQMCAGRDLYTY